MKRTEEIKRLINLIDNRDGLINCILNTLISSGDNLNVDDYHIFPIKYTSFKLGFMIDTDNKYSTLDDFDMIEKITIALFKTDKNNKTDILVIEFTSEFVEKGIIVMKLLTEPIYYKELFNQELNTLLDSLNDFIKDNLCSYCSILFCEECEKYKLEKLECPICYDDSIEMPILKMPCCLKETHLSCLVNCFKTKVCCPFCRYENYSKEFIESIKVYY
jgi:hypothetical protein